jgi:hypothetical protein
MAMGKGIRPDFQISGAEIWDVAPTILYLLDEPIPADMDGKVLTEIFEDDVCARKPPRYEGAAEEMETGSFVSYSNEESEQVAERLKGLGYL